MYDNKKPYVKVNTSIAYKVSNNLVIMKFMLMSRNTVDIIPSARYFISRVTLVQSLVLLWNAREFLYCSLKVSYCIITVYFHIAYSSVTFD